MRFKRTRFEGELRRGETTHAVEFEAWAGEDLRMHIEIELVPQRIAFALKTAIGKLGSTAESLVLEGRADTGISLYSDTLDLNSIQHGYPLSGLRVSARGVRIRGERSDPSELAMARLWFRGFKSYGMPPISSTLGRVEVRGAHRTTEEDEVTGFVALYAERGAPLSDWIAQADPMLTFLHLGLAFASGRRLQTPGFEAVSGSQFEGVYYAGSGFGRGLAPIHFMDQCAFVEALVRRYESPTPFPDALWTVAGWLHIETPFNAARFLMTMTALEMLCAEVLPSSGFALVDPDVFAPIKSKLLTVIEEAELGADIKHAFLVKIRNALVHRGQSAKGEAVWQKIVFVRELVSSVVLSEIQYDGPRQRYLGGAL